MGQIWLKLHFGDERAGMLTVKGQRLPMSSASDVFRVAVVRLPDDQETRALLDSIQMFTTR
jgi:hypothetical protein